MGLMAFASNPNYLLTPPKHPPPILLKGEQEGVTMQHDRELQNFQRRQRLAEARQEEQQNFLWQALKKAFGGEGVRFEDELERDLPSRRPGAWPL